MTAARYLVDTNVLSEVSKPKPDHRVERWLADNEPAIAVDPIILGELRFGIALLDPGRKRSSLEAWFAEGLRRLRIIPWDEKVGLRWGELIASLRRSGKSMPTVDSLIAATALTHDLVIVTMNTRDFESAGVELLDPTTP